MRSEPVARRRGRVDPQLRAVASAWERFASGEDEVEGVRPEILVSWQRCRDRYSVDPARERAPVDITPPSGIEQSVAAAELGAVAISILDDVRAIGGIVAVADGDGRVLGVWGDHRTLDHSRTQNLEAMFAWREAAIGTTGIGTALEGGGPVSIRRFEHWCAGLHEWSCAAVAVRDPLRDVPLGAIDISVRGSALPAVAASWLSSAADGVERRLRLRAGRAYDGLAEAHLDSVPAAPPAAARDGAAAGERADAALRDRVVALRGSRLVLVPAERVRRVEVARGTVWLDTDDGRLRAAARGLGELEDRLAAHAFLRVNRYTLVNLLRVRELAPAFKGGFWVLVDGCEQPIPVSRRRISTLRAALEL